MQNARKSFGYIAGLLVHEPSRTEIFHENRVQEGLANCSKPARHCNPKSSSRVFGVRPPHGVDLGQSLHYPNISDNHIPAIPEILPMLCRGVRGATTVEANDREEILTATRQLLALMIRANGIDAKDVACAQFTTTPDVNAEFPALAARQLGWLDVPLLCGHEMTVPGSLPFCIRILVQWNTDKSQSEIEHVYVREAKKLRPDLSQLPPVDWEELEQWISQQMSEQ